MRTYINLPGVLIVLAVMVLAGLLPATAGSQVLTTLISISQGTQPSGLIQAKEGNLYGACYRGGTNENGIIFQCTLTGAFTTLYSFSALDGKINSDGAWPQNSPIQGSDGNLYGTATEGGTNGTGTIFRITLSGAFTTLHSFYANTDGANPDCVLIQASDGNLYGTCEYGGAYGYGTIFKIAPEGVFTTLYSFTGGADGYNPYAGLIQARDGNLYGTTFGTYLGNANGGTSNGTIFKITPEGVFTLLHTFSALSGSLPGPLTNTDGANPYGLIQASDGNLYGTCNVGGANGSGTIFRITPTGTFTTLHSFSASTDGTDCQAALIQANDGYLYGTAATGGANGWGTLFRITLAGSFTTLYSFTDGTDGATPYAGLVQASDDKLYGTTDQSGGEYALGTIFALDTSLIPTLLSLSPTSANAAGPAFTLTLKGAHFASNSSANWTAGTTTTPLTTTFVSSAELKAAVPASLVATPGKASVTVVTSAVTSNAKLFTIKVTTLKLVSATLSKDSAGNYVANLTLKNAGYLTASSVSITKSNLNVVGTSAPLPVSLGNLAAGATTTVTLNYPASAGSSGQVVYLKAAGKFSGGSFTGDLKVSLP